MGVNEDIDMSDETQTQDQDSPNFARLRSQLAAAEAERDSFKTQYETARSQLVLNAAELAGFTAKEDGTFDGVANLLVKEFQGSLQPDEVPTRARFQALAEQYGIQPQVVTQATPELTPAQQLAALQAPGDALQRVAQIPQPLSDIHAEIAKAEAEGDWARAGALKDQQLKQMHA